MDIISNFIEDNKEIIDNKKKCVFFCSEAILHFDCVMIQRDSLLQRFSYIFSLVKFLECASHRKGIFELG